MPPLMSSNESDIFRTHSARSLSPVRALMIPAADGPQGFGCWTCDGAHYLGRDVQLAEIAIIKLEKLDARTKL